jgi:fermentation-respiration switch protein FrsA (DUF1100 family)
MSALTQSIALSAFLASLAPAAAAPYTVEKVRFQSGGETVVGHLYVPKGVHAANPRDAAIVTGAWMSIKEQMAGRYAQELAERGIVALAFDFRSWGESGGQPRAMESPAIKTADIRAAADFLATRPEVDRTRIHGLALCASSAYMAEAAAQTPLIRSVALVAPWLHDKRIVEQVYGGEAGVIQLLAASREADAHWKKTGQARFRPAASSTDQDAVMFQVPYYTEKDRGLIPQWENRFNVASWEGWLSLDAMKSAPRLAQPLLIVHSEAAAIPQGARQFFAAVKAPKQQLWLSGVNQFDFYDRDAPVNAAADAAAAHFRQGAVAQAPLGAPDEAQVVSVVSSIPLAVDLARYELAEAAFAPQVVVDYTSLWGGEASTMTPAELMTAWRGIVPGFTATLHELGPVRASVSGDRATASAFVDGRHWIGNRLWRPVGHYHWELARLDGQWKVTRMVFAMTQEMGDRALAQEAMARAKTPQQLASR